MRGEVRAPKKFDTAVLYLHGFPSSSLGFTARRLKRDIPRAGFLLMTFDFSGTPISDGKFEDKLISREIEDARCAIDFLCENFKFRQLILIGHSTGAIVASLYAYRDKRINKAVLSGAVSGLRNAVRYDFTDEQVRDFWTNGFVKYKMSRHWVNGKKIKKSYYDEFFKLDISRAIKKYKRPLLIIHGEKDVIPYDSEGFELYKKARMPKKFVLIKGADHSFTKPSHWKQMIQRIISFSRK